MAETLENYEENLPHNEFVQIAKETLKDILERDPYLGDLHPDITVEEVKSFIALEKGQAVRLILDKLDGTSESLVVPQNATVRDLKTAIRRSTDLKLERQGCPKKISWKYMWKTYWLTSNKEKLKDDNKKLKDYEIGSKSHISFVKRLKEK